MSVRGTAEGLVILAEVLEDWAKGVTPQLVDMRDDPIDWGGDLRMTVESEVATVVSDLEFLKSPEYAVTLRAKFDHLFAYADGYEHRLKRHAAKERRKIRRAEREYKANVSPDLTPLNQAVWNHSGIITISLPFMKQPNTTKRYADMIHGAFLVSRRDTRREAYELQARVRAMGALLRRVSELLLQTEQGGSNGSKPITATVAPQLPRPSGATTTQADDVHGALTHLYEATRSLVDAFCHYNIDELASVTPVHAATRNDLVGWSVDQVRTVSPVHAAIKQWNEAKDAASRQILRAAYLVDDFMAESPQPSTVLLHELHELGREYDILHWLWPFGPDKVIDFRMFNGIGYLEGLADQVIAMRGHWDKLTGLLGQPGQTAAPSARNARRMSRDEDGGGPAADDKPGRQIETQLPVPSSGPSLPLEDLSETEQNIVESLGTATMTGEKLAKAAGYPFNSNFKGTLSSLRKRGILDNMAPGYVLNRQYHYLLTADKGQDKGQD